MNPPTNRWIYGSANDDTKYLSFLTPIGGIARHGHGRRSSRHRRGERRRGHRYGDAEAGTASDDASTDASESSSDAQSEAATTSDGGPPEMSSPTYCGKAVFTDLHTSSSLYSQVNNVPAGCSGAPMTAQQKALEYLFFDLSACVSPDSVPPPPIPPPAK